MYSLELILSPALYDYRSLQKHHTVVAIDILRATSAICAAFEAGAEQIVPLNSLNNLQQYRKIGYLIAAERNGAKVDNAEYGNSPTEYLRSDLHGKKLAHSTTNGTVCILRAASADRVLVGCFNNLSALADKLTSEPQDVVMLCSGWKQEFSLEDTLFAGALAQRLTDSENYSPCNDAVWMAMELWCQAKKDIYGYCQKASHVQRLQQMGYDNDIRHAMKLDTCKIVPMLKEQALVL